ncbi:MAG TPA: hypothetical protein VFU71_21045 [Burkholderiaceae bacterium]|nr:hypothetical protein [Burkholderiaceae bacterium]
MAKDNKTPGSGERATVPGRPRSRADATSDNKSGTPFVLTLRDVEAPLPPTEAAKPATDGLVVSDRGFQSGPYRDDARAVEMSPPRAAGEPPPESLVLSNTEPRPEPYLGDPDAERVAQRAARRAQVRRDRVRSAAAAAEEDDKPQMLVLSGDDDACRELCELLQTFGFGVQRMSAPPELSAPWPFVAVFVTSPMRGVDGGDAIDLCNHVREMSRLPGEKKPVLVLAAPQLSSTDRVRAGLAGCNEILLGSPGRGGVAQLLDARGIALPSDARRG